MQQHDSTIGVYIHVPFCHHRCPYCDFYIEELRDRPARARLEFTDNLSKEWKLRSQLHSIAERTLETIYFGGGTPSVLKPESVKELIHSIISSVPHLSDDLEITLEANPENLTRERCNKWAETGINRLSIGIQSFHPEELKLLERPHSPDLAVQAVRHAHQAGIDNISVDLMFALPGQSLSQWKDNLEKAVSLSPQHLSFYGLTYHENTGFYQMLEARELTEVDEDLQAEMYLWGSEYLKANGFEHYEISNFAQPGFRSRHNQRYWNRQDVLALGPGAHGNIGSLRYANDEDLGQWGESLKQETLPAGSSEVIDDDLYHHEQLFTALRRVDGVERKSTPRLYDACEKWAEQVPLEAKPWFRLNSTRFTLTTEGWLRSDGIIEQVTKMITG